LAPIDNERFGHGLSEKLSELYESHVKKAEAAKPANPSDMKSTL